MHIKEKVINYLNLIYDINKQKDIQYNHDKIDEVFSSSKSEVKVPTPDSPIENMTHLFLEFFIDPLNHKEQSAVREYTKKMKRYNFINNVSIVLGVTSLLIFFMSSIFGLLSYCFDETVSIYLYFILGSVMSITFNCFITNLIQKKVYPNYKSDLKNNIRLTVKHLVSFIDSIKDEEIHDPESKEFLKRYFVDKFYDYTEKKKFEGFPFEQKVYKNKIDFFELLSTVISEYTVESPLDNKKLSANESLDYENKLKAITKIQS